MLITKTKQPLERWPVFGSILYVQSETDYIVLSSSNVTAHDKDGNNVTTSFIKPNSIFVNDDPKGNYSNNRLGCILQGGEAIKSPYTITFFMSTNESLLFETEIKVPVAEVPEYLVYQTTTTTTTT